MNRRRYGVSTVAVHGPAERRPDWAPVAPPLLQSTTFTNPVGAEEDLLYSRYGNNPTQVALGRKYALLEGTEDAVFLASGSGATALAHLAVLRPGDHLLSSEWIYGGSRQLFDQEFTRLGIEVSYVRPIATLARNEGLALLVDATFATPVNFRPVEAGADVVIASATKYLNGHSDVIAGAVAGSTSFVDEVRRLMRLWGQSIDPHAAWLVDRGLRTLAVRMERHNANGLAVARWAERQRWVARVHYPGLESHPDHELASEILGGYGGMVGLELRGGPEAAGRLLTRLKLIIHAPSLGGVESLISEPRITSHSEFTAAERERLGIPDGFLRLSCGIEDADDIIADLEQAGR